MNLIKHIFIFIFILVVGKTSAQKLVFDSTYVSTFPFKFTDINGCILVNDSSFLIYGSIDEPFAPSPKHMQRYSFDSFELDYSFQLSSLYVENIPNCVFYNDSIYSCGRNLFKAKYETGGFNLSFMDSLNSDYNCLRDIHLIGDSQYFIKETGKYLGGYKYGLVPGSDTVRTGGFYMYSINNNGTYDRNFPHNTDGSVNSIYPGNDSTYFISGNFTHYDGQARNKIVKIDCYGNLLSGQTPFAQNSYVPAVTCADSDGKIMVIGALILNEYPNDTVSIVRLNDDLSLDTTFNFLNFRYQYSIQGMSYFLRLDDGYLISGAFDDFFGVERHNIARITLDGNIVMNEFNHSGFDHVPFVGLQPYTNNVQRLKDYVYVSGFFDGYNGQKVSPVVRFKIVSNDTIPTIATDSFTELLCYPNPTNDELTIHFPSNENGIYELSIVDLNGKLVQIITFTQPKNQFSIAHLDTGIYFLKNQLQHIRIVKN